MTTNAQVPTGATQTRHVSIPTVDTHATVTRDSSAAVLNVNPSINAHLVNINVHQMLTVFRTMERMTVSVPLVTRDQALSVTM
jgi:hypothetical protein